MSAGSKVSRRFGVELEFMSPNWDGIDYYDLADVAQAHGLEIVPEEYGHEVSEHWKVIYDSSVSGGEVVSPPIFPTRLDEVRTACDVIDAVDGRAAEGQGVHVHHDMTETSTAERIRLSWLCEHWQDALLAYDHARDHDEWCSQADHSTWSSLRRDGLRPFTRYLAINFDPLHRYGTVEFRSLGNTLDYSVIEPWVLVTQAVCAAAVYDAIPDPVREVEEQSVETMARITRAREREYASAERYTRWASSLGDIGFCPCAPCAEQREQRGQRRRLRVVNEREAARRRAEQDYASPTIDTASTVDMLTHLYGANLLDGSTVRTFGLSSGLSESQINTILPAPAFCRARA